MSTHARVRSLAVALAALTAVPSGAVLAQNDAPNPYRTVAGVWAPLPDARSWGSTSAVEVSPDGETIWAIDRCGANNCEADHNEDIVFQFDKDGNILNSFGAGLIQWPHGIDVDAEGNVWVADARGGEGRGHQVLKFSPSGEVLMRLGTAGVAGRTRTTLDQPNDVLIAPDGSIFVADGHPADGNNRIVKYARGRHLSHGVGRDGLGAGAVPHAPCAGDGLRGPPLRRRP